MRIYFYHTQNIQLIRERLSKGTIASHLLYGAHRLPSKGIGVLWHKSMMHPSRLRQMIYNTYHILRSVRHFDVLYATHYRGIEPVIFLRALHLFPRPIVIWHHQPIVKSPSKLRGLLSPLFYRGIDEMFFFSEKLINDSAKTGIVPRAKMHLGHWGADLETYDRIMQEPVVRHGFISTGKEMRDFPTLVQAFNITGAPVDIYLNRRNGKINHEEMFRQLVYGDNVRVHFVTSFQPYSLMQSVNRAACVVICCKETKYTVGLTTVVEALALGLPIICSRNPQIPVDFDKERCGISVAYGDVEGWVAAIRFILGHPEEAREMGQRGRRLAERLYNDERCAEEVAEILRKVCK